MVVVYQTSDALSIDLEPNSVDLVISSPPLEILKDRASELFNWLDKSVSPAGVLMFDMPGQYNKYTISMWEGERKSPWHFEWGIALTDFYPDIDTQSLCAYSRNHLPRPDNISYRRWVDREMAHRCEYDSIYVENLIKLYTQPGQTVLDPFCGTGTVPRTAHRLGRNGIGIDRRCPFTNKL